MNKELKTASDNMQQLNCLISKEFLEHVLKKIRFNTLANGDEDDSAKAMGHATEMINSLQPKSPIELMLVAQMLTIFNLQQKASTYAGVAKNPDLLAQCTNSVIKLSNVFVQQAQLLHRLQGGNSQKVLFEHIHIHDGAQAIIGTVYPQPDRSNNL